MRVNVGAIITEKRKEKKITQQDLADFIGVSKASVSKWETGQTYPDITLLPLIAAYFDISIDFLMGYESQLSKEEIARIYQSLKRSLEVQPAAEVQKTIASFIRRYYSCYPFIIQMGLFIMNHYDRLPGENNAAKVTTYMTKAKELFVHVRTNAQDPELISEAFKLEAYSLLILQDADGVLAILGEFVPTALPVESLISGAFQLKGEPEKADRTLQSALFQYITMMMSLFSIYLMLLVTKPAKYQETVSRARQFAQVFDLRQLHPVVLLNFLLAAAVGDAQMENEKACLEIVTEFTEILETTTLATGFHGDAYFDQVEEWFATLEIGNQMPRDTQLMKSDLATIVIENPVFLTLRTTNTDFQALVTRLAAIKKQEEQQHEQ
jgi:transcriptional regulator with XRE-family HTH domain